MPVPYAKVREDFIRSLKEAGIKPEELRSVIDEWWEAGSKYFNISNDDDDADESARRHVEGDE